MIEARVGIAWQDTAVGIGVILLAGVVAWQTTIIPENAAYARVGPKVFPWVDVALLAVLGVTLAITGLRGGWEHEEAGTTDWYALGWLSAGLLANVVLISQIGFILAATILFVCTARAFGSAAPLRDAAIGFTLAIIAYVGFDRVLGYKIGHGLIEGLI